MRCDAFKRSDVPMLFWDGFLQLYDCLMLSSAQHQFDTTKVKTVIKGWTTVTIEKDLKTIDVNSRTPKNFSTQISQDLVFPEMFVHFNQDAVPHVPKSDSHALGPKTHGCRFERRTIQCFFSPARASIFTILQQFFPFFQKLLSSSSQSHPSPRIIFLPNRSTLSLGPETLSLCPLLRQSSI